MPVVIVQPKKEPSPLVQIFCWLVIIGVGGLTLLGIAGAVMSTDRDNARTLNTTPTYQHASGGSTHTIVEQGQHLFNDGVTREGVKVRDAEGYEFWVEKTAFDRMYRQQ